MKNMMMGMFILFASLFVTEQAQANYWQLYPATVQTLEYSTIFNGDKHGDFAGDYVANLSDGSQWKVHPKDRGQYSRWNEGDIVHISARTSWYWFKREHKFELVNDTRNESVRAMIVQHAFIPFPKTIVDSYVYATATCFVPHYDYVTVVDMYGNVYVETVTTWVEEPCGWQKCLYLSDGSHFVIKDRLHNFTEGKKVYIGAQGTDDAFDFIIITEREREAKWTYARYDY